MNVGQRIKKRRKELGLSVDELAEKIGKDRSTVYRYESNYIESLPTTVLEPLAKALNVTPGFFMGWESDQDEWTKSFCESVDEQLAMTDSADIQDSGVNYSRLSEIASGVNNLSLSEACNIADELGCSLDAMVGKEPPEDTPSSRRLKEFIELFAQLTEDQQKMLIMQMKGLLSNE